MEDCPPSAMAIARIGPSAGNCRRAGQDKRGQADLLQFFGLKLAAQNMSAGNMPGFVCNNAGQFVAVVCRHNCSGIDKQVVSVAHKRVQTVVLYNKKAAPAQGNAGRFIKRGGRFVKEPFGLLIGNNGDCLGGPDKKCQKGCEQPYAASQPG